MRRLLILLALALSGGATAGVQMTDAEAAQCKAVGCSAWTESELRQLAEKFFAEGFQRGARSSGRAI